MGEARAANGFSVYLVWQSSPVYLWPGWDSEQGRGRIRSQPGFVLSPKSCSQLSWYPQGSFSPTCLWQMSVCLQEGGLLPCSPPHSSLIN